MTCFPEEREPDFVHSGRADSPSVADVDLLRTIIRQVAKSGQVGAARLETCKRLLKMMLREIVVAGQVLLAGQLVIDLRRKLVRVLVSDRYCLEKAASLVWRGYELIEQIERRLVHARRGNLLGRKYGGIRCAVRDGCVAAPQSAQASSPIIQYGRIIERSGECAVAAL